MCNLIKPSTVYVFEVVHLVNLKTTMNFKIGVIKRMAADNVRGLRLANKINVSLSYLHY